MTTTNKTCLIYQPVGLGDVLWLQKLVDVVINEGYTVYYPVGDVYYDLIVKYLKKDNLIWVRESDDFPLKQYYGTVNIHQTENELYVPASFADRYLPKCSVMAAKYYFLSIPISDYRKSFDVIRDEERENKLIETYGLTGDYVIVNRAFGTDPDDSDNFTVDTDKKVHYMNLQQDKSNGFNVFDWIKAFENASEIHTVGTSICYLIDKYCHNNEIHMYQRRHPNQEHTYHNEINLVYKNPNWIYENE